MPRIGVRALIGSSFPPEGSVLMKRHIEVQNAPSRAEAGSRLRWLSVLIIIRATCGTLKPTKAIGPQ